MASVGDAGGDQGGDLHDKQHRNTVLESLKHP